MEARRLGRSGLNVSALGLGGNTFGRDVDGQDAVRVIQQALDLGVTFIDTADSYSAGRSEELIGEALGSRRASVIVATKCGRPMAEGPYARGLSRRWITQSIERSLRRLRTDYVDLFQAHHPDPETPLEETLRTLDDHVRQGKVRYIGCSNYEAWDLARGLGISERLGVSSWVSAQDKWNLLEGLADPTLQKACAASGVGLIPYSPLASGFLTGKYRRGEQPEAGTRAAANANILRGFTEEKFDAVERLKAWAAERGHTTAVLAIAWLLAHAEVSTVIVGARAASQIEQNLRALDWKLTPEERDEALAVARGRG
ncbi:MAG: aldo/keto reductase [Chloroflexi bacterium]|nr:aldo/keto reductase [Chloroflexota bacterium]